VEHAALRSRRDDAHEGGGIAWRGGVAVLAERYGAPPSEVGVRLIAAAAVKRCSSTR
jgi:hypothetical protein